MSTIQTAKKQLYVFGESAIKSEKNYPGLDFMLNTLFLELHTRD